MGVRRHVAKFVVANKWRKLWRKPTEFIHERTKADKICAIGRTNELDLEQSLPSFSSVYMPLFMQLICELANNKLPSKDSELNQVHAIIKRRK